MPELHRPRFHPTAPAHWMSDPNGPVFWEGRYHVFYQHNPLSSRWGLMHWGHLVSDDLLLWHDEGIAIRPQPTGPDSDGCWSGCIRIIDGEPVAFYTGASGVGAAHEQVVIRAVGNSALSGFTRTPAQPVVPAAAPRMRTAAQRDPFLLRWKDRWIMLLGTGLDGDEPGGAVVAWESFDTIHWSYTGVVFTLPAGGSGIDTGPVWECPQLLEIDGQWVLLISVQMPGTPDPLCLYVVWFTGSFDGRAFTPSATGLVDSGEVYYAAAVAPAADGRPLMWAWLQEAVGRRGGEGAWAGAFSMTRELRLQGGKLVTAPARELDRLWAEPVLARTDVVLTADAMRLDVITGDAFRVRAIVAGAGFRLILGADAHGEDVALDIGGDGAGFRLRALVGRNELGSLPLEPAGGSIAIAIYVDLSIVEVFAGGGALTFRVEGVIGARDGIRLTTTGPTSLLESIDVARLRT